jgi:hypothetical protein
MMGEHIADNCQADAVSFIGVGSFASVMMTSGLTHGENGLLRLTVVQQRRSSFITPPVQHLLFLRT